MGRSKREFCFIWPWVSGFGAWSFAMDQRGLRTTDLGFTTTNLGFTTTDLGSNTESTTFGASGGRDCERARGAVVKFPPCYPWWLSTRWLTH